MPRIDGTIDGFRRAAGDAGVYGGSLHWGRGVCKEGRGVCKEGRAGPNTNNTDRVTRPRNIDSWARKRAVLLGDFDGIDRRGPRRLLIGARHVAGGSGPSSVYWDHDI